MKLSEDREIVWEIQQLRWRPPWLALEEVGLQYLPPLSAGYWAVFGRTRSLASSLSV